MTGAKTFKQDFEFIYNNKKILITHGDGIVKSEYGYRFMRSIIRSSLFIKLYKLFPAKLTCKFAKIFSRVKSGYNHNDQYVEAIRHDTLEYAQNKWNENYDIVCIGHYHQDGIISHAHKKLIYLGDWLNKFTVTIINEETCWQGDWKQFRDLS
jgi:UDP-2,3-diacylglucosamine hydrolase